MGSEGEEGGSSLKFGERAAVVLDATCCYAEKGGQAGDKGFLTWEEGRFKVEDTQEEEGVGQQINQDETIDTCSGTLEVAWCT